MTTTETTFTAEAATARLRADTCYSIAVIFEIVEFDRSNRDEHLEWLCTAPIDEIAHWAWECGLTS